MAFMVTVILPGYSIHNKEWLEETAQKIGTDGEIRPIYWEHWTDPDSKFDAKEKARLLDGVAGKRVVDIIAKSIGTFVAGYIIEKSPEKIRKVILNGICLTDLGDDEKEILKSALKLISPENIICFQNEEDPHGDFEQAKKFLSDVDPEIVIVSKPRDDHEYPYFEEFGDFLKS
jgi:pimeloyl-ACP methyl ester carboxylesterase